MLEESCSHSGKPVCKAGQALAVWIELVGAVEAVVKQLQKRG
jgi:hypothetical protein